MGSVFSCFLFLAKLFPNWRKFEKWIQTGIVEVLCFWLQDIGEPFTLCLLLIPTLTSIPRSPEVPLFILGTP